MQWPKEKGKMEWPTKTITNYGMANKNKTRLWNGHQKQ
jgi:hypothetical protein